MQVLNCDIVNNDFPFAITNQCMKKNDLYPIYHHSQPRCVSYKYLLQYLQKRKYFITWMDFEVTIRFTISKWEN